MYNVEKITINDDVINNGLSIGGNYAYGKSWPKNNDGEELLHLLSIDCEKFFESYGLDYFPKKGYLSIFTTYKNNDYFLDLVTEVDECLKNKYTMIHFEIEKNICKSELMSFIPETYASLETFSYGKEEYPMDSFFANNLPLGVNLLDIELENYHFIGQLNPSLFPMSGQAVFGLSDALGYIFLSKNINNSEVKGLFIVGAG